MKKLCACNPMGSGNGGGDLRGMQERAVNGRVVSKSMFCRKVVGAFTPVRLSNILASRAPFILLSTKLCMLDNNSFM